MDPAELSTPTHGSKSDTQLQAVGGVQLKLPPYWPNDPELWFTQVEAQFITRGITVEKTKYAYIVSSLQSEYAQEVRDVLLSPPTTEPYTHLKSELIKRTSASEQKRLHQLLTAEELGDRKPTQLLRRMEQLLGGAKLESSIFTQLFLQRLPHHAQSILASSRDAMTVNQLAQLADRIVEVHVSSSPGISNISSTNAAAAPSPQSHCEPPGQNVSIVSQICLILVSNCLKRSQFYLKHVSDKMSQFETFLTFETQLRLPPFESNLRHYSALSKWCQKGLKNVSKRDLGRFSGWTVFSGT